MSKMSDEKNREFEELSSYIGFFATAVWNVAENSANHPSRNLMAAPGKASKSQLLSGLRQAANDTIEATQHFKFDQIAAFDYACREQRVLTLSEVRRRYWRRYKAIVEKLQLRNDTDYYLATGLLIDTAAAIGPAERRLLPELTLAYESCAAQKAQ
jgi:hypothetical protein